MKTVIIRFRRTNFGRSKWQRQERIMKSTKIAEFISFEQGYIGKVKFCTWSKNHELFKNVNHQKKEPSVFDIGFLYAL